MKTKLPVFLFVLPLLTAGTLSLAQTAIIPSGGGTSTAPHPDSITSSDVYGLYSLGTDGAGAPGGALLGKISIPGDPLMWSPIPISVTCLGKVALTSFTDAKNNFLLRAVNVNGALSLQGDAKRQMETHLEGCAVTASLTGFTSSTIILSHHNFRDAPDIGTITLKPADHAKGTAVSSTTKDAPPAALKLYEKARHDSETENLDHVAGNLRDAVAIDPKFAEAWYQIGRLEQAANPDQARSDYAKAIAADPQFILPHEQLLALDSQEGKWKNALTDGAHALALDPRGTPQVWFGYAEGILKAYAAGALPLAKLKVGETSAQNALNLDPQHTVPAEQLLALILAQEKNYTSAIDHLNNCLTYFPKGSGSDQVRQQIAQLEVLKTGAAK